MGFSYKPCAHLISLLLASGCLRGLSAAHEPFIHLFGFAIHYFFLLLLLNKFHHPWHQALVRQQKVVVGFYRLIRVILVACSLLILVMVLL